MLVWTMEHIVVVLTIITSCSIGSSSSTGAIAGGVAAGAALLFAIPAIGFAWYRRRKPQEHFFDVPGKRPIEQANLENNIEPTLIEIHYLLQLRRIQRSILASLKDFHYENYKLQRIPSAIKTFSEEVGLARSIKED